MRLFRAAIEKIGLGLAVISGASVLLVVFFDCWDVFSTNVLLTAVPGAIEVTQSSMVMAVFGGLAYTQFRRGHIRMELLYMNVSRKKQAFMDLCSCLVGILYFSFMCYTSTKEAAWSWSMREISHGLIQYPIYPVRMLISVGLAVLLCQLAIDTIDYWADLVGKKPIQTDKATVDRTAIPI